MLRAVLALIRLPNTLTAFADVLAGAALAGVDPLAPDVLAAGAGSMLLYGGGIALNDVCDLRKDRSEHPDRVLPRGDLRLRTASVIAVLLLLAGTASAFIAGSSAHAAVTVALLCAIVGYDTLPDRFRNTGAAVMGACRGLNLARGITLGAAPPAAAAAAVAGHVWLVAMITAVSTFEGRRAAPGLRVAVALLPLPYLVPFLTGDPSFHVARWAALGAGALLGTWVTRPGFGATPRAFLVVKRAVFTLVVFDALYALAATRLPASLLLLALLPLILLIARVIGQRGS